HPLLIKRLFELEVPEVADGIVEIKSVAREPGARSKVAVFSHDEQVDPVGACVGHRGARVQAIVDELRGEKVDIVRWSEDVTEYLASALSPAKVSQVIPNPDDASALVIVPDDQLSLAIGRRGQNVRLAARLAGWKIDIRSQAQHLEEARLARELEARAAMPGIRVWELARQVEVPISELLDVLEEEGIDASSHASMITGADAQMIRELLAGG
ncbi:MAG: translation initiation factor IF-2 N-terminal domain-containing protein, partial [Armatimonadota bacterium]